MRKYNTEEIRNVGLFGHQGAGKTSLTEALLYVSGTIDRLGRVDDGNSTGDFDPEEVKRRMTLFAALAPLEWKNTKINLIDTPGFFDFVADVVGALAVTEGAVLVASATAGVEVGLEQTWAMAEEARATRLLFVNKMDKENADFQRVLDDCSEKLSGRLVPLQLPIGAAETFTGVVDLVANKAYSFDDRGRPQEIPIPADMQERVQSLREKLTEEAAEADDALTEKYLETMELTDEEIRRGLTERIRSGQLVGALCGSSSNLKGISLLLDALVELVPNPAWRGQVTGADGQTVRRTSASEPFSALVFKTTSDPYKGKLTYMRVFSGVLKPNTVVRNTTRGVDEKITDLTLRRGKHEEPVDEAPAGDIVVVTKLTETLTGDTLSDPGQPFQLPVPNYPEPLYARSIHPKSKADEDRLSAATARLLQEDPTLKILRSEETKEFVIYGVGDMQIDVVVDRLKKMGVDVELGTPKVPYRETIRGKVEQNYRHKKQTGGRGQFADVWLRLEPLPRGAGFEFVDAIVGGVVPRNFIPSVEKGVRKQMEEGILAGYPVVDVRVTLFDGKYHEVDSSDIAFQIAAAQGFKEGALKANPVLLEPIAEVEVQVPEQFMGDVIGDLNTKRARILGMEPMGKGLQRIKATVPMAEMQRYSIDLRSITQGRGRFSMKFSHYEEAPPQVSEQVVAAARAAAAAH